MIGVSIEGYSIRGVEESAAAAFAAGLPESACPYLTGSIAWRVWMLHYVKCAAHPIPKK